MNVGLNTSKSLSGIETLYTADDGLQFAIVSILLNPYQGLKLNPVVGQMRDNNRLNTSKSLSGIETKPLLPVSPLSPVSILLNPYQGLKPDLLSLIP